MKRKSKFIYLMGDVTPIYRPKGPKNRPKQPQTALIHKTQILLYSRSKFGIKAFEGEGNSMMEGAQA